MRCSLILLSVTIIAGACTKQEASTTVATPNIKAEEVRYNVNDDRFVGYLAWDANKKGTRPGIVIVHQWWGHSDYVRTRARMLAEMGYTALALDMYGEGKVATHPEDATKFMNEAISDPQVAKARFEAAYDLLRAHETTNDAHISAIGYCFGGAVVLHMARFGLDLDGVVSFHGSLGTGSPAKPGAVKAKVLVLTGEADVMVPPEQVGAFRQEMESAGANFEIVAYPGVKHAFTDPAGTENGQKFGLPLEYNEAADKDSWARMDALLKSLY